jgi:hypothetical protein
MVGWYIPLNFVLRKRLDWCEQEKMKRGVVGFSLVVSPWSAGISKLEIQKFYS